MLLDLDSKIMVSRAQVKVKIKSATHFLFSKTGYIAETSDTQGPHRSASVDQFAQQIVHELFHQIDHAFMVYELEKRFELEL